MPAPHPPVESACGLQELPVAFVPIAVEVTILGFLATTALVCPYVTHAAADRHEFEAPQTTSPWGQLFGATPLFPLHAFLAAALPRSAQLLVFLAAKTSGKSVYLATQNASERALTRRSPATSKIFVCLFILLGQLP